jgi:glycosyltransferase involved in cell wall biosynthesis
MRLGMNVDLFTPRPEGIRPPDLQSVAVHTLPLPRHNDSAEREQSAIRANEDLRFELIRHGPYDLVYERYSLWSFAGMEYGYEVGTPAILEVNAPLIEEQSRHRVLVDRASAERIAERVIERASVLVAVSKGVAQYLQRYVNAEGRIQVVPNGVDPGRFPRNLRPSCPDTKGRFTVGFVGTLKPWHGVDTLVDAFERFHQNAPNSRLLIVGDGPEKSRLEAECVERNLTTAVAWTGSVAPGEVPGLLASMDVAVAPYPALSGFYFSPLKVYEYMAAGLPVVASSIGQLQELLQDSVNGTLCPPGNPAALAAALERLYRDEGLCHRLGQAAREKVVREHTWDKVARRLLHLCASACAVSVSVSEASIVAH